MKEKKTLFARLNDMIEDDTRWKDFLYGTLIGILGGIAIASFL